MSSPSSSPPPATPEQNEGEDKPEKEEEEKEEELDEEGLSKSGFDVIICGTGLVQAILGCALALAGKTLLHCDGADRYGEGDASLNLSDLVGWEAEEKNLDKLESSGEGSEKSSLEEDKDSDGNRIDLDPRGGMASLLIHSKTPTSLYSKTEFSIGKEVRTPYGPGKVVSGGSDGSIAVRLTSWTLANGTHPIGYLQCSQLESMVDVYRHEVLNNQSRSFSLDITPVVLHANGNGVSGLIDSGVSEYVEFMAMESLQLLMEPLKKDKKREGMLDLTVVPCSKGNVFTSKLLSPLDKRKLMKLLQLASDYGETYLDSDGIKEGSSEDASTEAETSTNDNASASSGIECQDISNLNERRIQAKGMSLIRPQNKSIAESAMTSLLSPATLSTPFSNYLSKDFKLTSPRLQNIVMHALALSSISGNVLRTQDGMDALYRHLRSLGRFGPTAFISTMYGGGELAQAFCRSCAVHGGLYMLRRCPKQILTGKAHADGQRINGILLGGDQQGDNDYPSSSVPDKVIACQHVVVPSDALPLLFKRSQDSKKTRVLRRISILRGNISLPQSEQRCVVILPPNTAHVQNENAVFGLTLDSTLKVTPVGYTVLHLATLVEESEGGDLDHAVLERALHSLLTASSSSSESKNDAVPPQELYHVTYSFLESDYKQSQNASQPIPKGVHVCHRPSLSVSVESAFQEAQRIFNDICNNTTSDGENNNNSQTKLEFLKMSLAMKEKIQKLRGDYGFGTDEQEEDDEKMVLESALNLIQQPVTATSQKEAAEENNATTPNLNNEASQEEETEIIPNNEGGNNQAEHAADT